MRPGHTVGGYEEDGHPAPLTRRNSSGEIYQRLATVEEQIRQAVRLAPDALRERVGVRDEASPDFLQEESLVYLIRHYRRISDGDLVDDLAQALLGRCAARIDTRLRRLGSDAAEEGYGDVVGQLFEQILDLASDRGDFLQVRFWHALGKLTVHAFNQQLKLHKRAQASVPLSSLAGHDPSGNEESAGGMRPDDMARMTAPSGEQDVIRSDVIRDALRRLDEPIRSAYLLRHYYGWSIEDQNPAVRTISRHFGKEPRTIRNWLARAETALQDWRGHQQ